MIIIFLNHQDVLIYKAKIEPVYIDIIETICYITKLKFVLPLLLLCCYNN
jgi:hypothetical protein